MELRKEKVFFCKEKEKVKEIYFSSFVKKERMSFILMQVMSLLWNTDFYVYYEDKKVVGFIYSAHLLKQTFIMFFAVDEKLRSKGYGSKIIDDIANAHPNNKVIVSIEPCIDGTSNYYICCKRKEFYQRNGFNETDYYMKIAGIKQEIMIRNGSFDFKKFKRFFMLYSNFTVVPKIWKKD